MPGLSTDLILPQQRRMQLPTASLWTPGVRSHRYEIEDPRINKLNRNYGDDFNYTSDAEFLRRWRFNTAQAAYGPPNGASGYYWNMDPGAAWIYPVANGAIYRPCPQGDWEVGVRISGHYYFGGMMGLTLTNSSGNGIGFSCYDDGKTYLWVINSWAYSSTSNSIASQPDTSGRSYWLFIKKSGTTYSGRYAYHRTDQAAPGLIVSSYTSGLAASTYDYVGICHMYAPKNGAWMRLHWLNFVSPSFNI